MPLARSRVGQLVFHAGAVVLRRGCVAFLGQSGRGKSTLVASFATSGYSFLTDDGLLVECVGGTHRVLPSHPSIRLWRDSEEALLDRSAVPQPAVQYTSKSRFVAGGKIDFNDEPQVLRAVYLLGDGTAPQPTIEPLSESEALMALVRNSFLLDIDQRSALASHFDELARMARVPMFYRLDYPRRFEELPLVIAAITSHAREYTTGPDMPAAEG
jgi:hypothetical protein